MAGNSLRSDVLPVIAIGGRAIHIPHDLTWDYEKVSDERAATSSYGIVNSIYISTIFHISSVRMSHIILWVVL